VRSARLGDPRLGEAGPQEHSRRPQQDILGLVVLEATDVFHDDHRIGAARQGERGVQTAPLPVRRAATRRLERLREPAHPSPFAYRRRAMAVAAAREPGVEVDFERHAHARLFGEGRRVEALEQSQQARFDVVPRELLHQRLDRDVRRRHARHLEMQRLGRGKITVRRRARNLRRFRRGGDGRLDAGAHEPRRRLDDRGARPLLLIGAQIARRTHRRQRSCR
jgi:hypothetical protein